MIMTNIHHHHPRLFKVIDVGTPGKLVSSARYDKQQIGVCNGSLISLMLD